MSQMSQKMLSTDHLKHASLQTTDGAWSLVPALPLASAGTVRGQPGTAPLLVILQDRLDCHWMGGNVPGLQKALIQPQERFSVVLCREMFGRGWQERWACLEHGNVLRDLGIHGFLGRG